MKILTFLDQILVRRKAQISIGNTLDQVALSDVGDHSGSGTSYGR